MKIQKYFLLEPANYTVDGRGGKSFSLNTIDEVNKHLKLGWYVVREQVNQVDAGVGFILLEQNTETKVHTVEEVLVPETGV